MPVARDYPVQAVARDRMAAETIVAGQMRWHSAGQVTDAGIRLGEGETEGRAEYPGGMQQQQSAHLGGAE